MNDHHIGERLLLFWRCFVHLSMVSSKSDPLIFVQFRAWAVVLESNQDYDTAAQTFIRGIQMLEDTNEIKTLKGEQHHFQRRMRRRQETMAQVLREL